MHLDLSGFGKKAPTAPAILYFRGAHKFLSNMQACDVILPADERWNLPPIPCKSVESAYQAWKTTEPALRQLLTELDPVDAKKVAHRDNFPLRIDDSPNARLTIMRELLMQKFSINNPALLKKLLDTGESTIMEGNIWNDTFWGIDLCHGKGGQNYLGLLLMEVRAARQGNTDGTPNT